MHLGTILSALVCFILCGCAANGDAHPRKDHSKIDIDGEIWTITLEAEKCEGRVSAAIARYWEAPLYRKERNVMRERFFVNETSDCWVELYVEGVDDTSVIFKVTRSNIVVDKRLFSFWRPHIMPYPEGPRTLY